MSAFLSFPTRSAITPFFPLFAIEDGFICEWFMNEFQCDFFSYFFCGGVRHFMPTHVIIITTRVFMSGDEKRAFFFCLSSNSHSFLFYFVITIFCFMLAEARRLMLSWVRGHQVIFPAIRCVLRTLNEGAGSFCWPDFSKKPLFCIIGEPRG